MPIMDFTTMVLKLQKLVSLGTQHRLVAPTSPKTGWWRLVEPSHRVVNQSGDDTTPHKRHCREAEHADKDWLPKR